MIFNRWGQLVFEFDQLDFEWDATFKGTMVQDGTYTWRIDYVSNSGREVRITGHVNVLR
jgi:gliding motility-associated-like protein